jgi:glycosyltransferase involved in cell wall biosynthesis
MVINISNKSAHIKKKKLCFLLPAHWSAQMGGAEYQVKILLDKIIKSKKFDIVYLTRCYHNDFIPDGYQIQLITKVGPINRLAFFFDAFILFKKLYAINPDIIYQRVGCAYTEIACVYAKFKKCVLIWHVAHDSTVIPSSFEFSHQGILKFIEKKILEYGVRNCDWIISQTFQQSDCLKKYYGRKNAAVIKNFHPAPKENIIKKLPLKIVWVANFKPWKQPEYFIRLAEEFQKKGIKAKFQMVGKSSEWNKSWQRSIENKIAEVENIEYLGELSADEVNRILALAHIFVNTSAMEGFPNTFIQAWLREVPVVSLCCNPDRIITTHGVGFVAGDFSKLAAQVERLARDEKLRVRIGRAARSYALHHHSERNIDKIIEIFDKNLIVSG